MSDDKTRIVKLRDDFLAGNADFSAEEVADMIRTSSALAARAVLTLAAETLKEHPKFRKHTIAYNQLIQDIPPASSCSIMRCKETDNHVCICLSIGPADYNTIPTMLSDKYVPELQDIYDFYQRTACAFWLHLREVHNWKLPACLDELKVDPSNPISLFFDEKHPRRVIICGMWRDAQGRTLVKRP